ncbi:MAG: DUF2207 domain-containing protein [Lachnospiraceae bacterium]|nr:DUF2207 domain-containing protein [Lachnospiraceae bacterium]
MRNKLVTIIVVLVIVINFGLPLLMAILSSEDASLNPNDYARITDVEYRAEVVDEPGSNGKVVITERLTFDIHAASKSNPFWELWRDLCEDYYDGVKIDYKVNSVKQILPDGSEIIYEESDKLYWDDYDYVNWNTEYGPGKWYHSEGPYDEDMQRYECVFFYIDGVYREEMVFEIEYEMNNAALRYNDCSDLYLSLYSGDTIEHLESLKGEILIPNDKMPAKGNYTYTTYGTNSNTFPVTESDSVNPGYHTFSFELNEEQLQFKPYNEYIEFDLVAYGEDKHIFTEHASYNDYYFDDVLTEILDEQQDYIYTPAKYKRIKTIVFVVLILGSIVILIYAFTYKLRLKSKYVFYKPDTEIDLYRDIPSDLDPNFAASLVFCKHKEPKDDSGIYSAILLSLARKKYIELREIGNSDIEILIKNPPKAPAPLTQSDSAFSTAQTPVQSNEQTPFGMNDIGFDPDFKWDIPPEQTPIVGTPSAETTVAEPTLNPAPWAPFDETVTNSVEADVAYEGPAIEYEPLTTTEQYYFNLIVRHAVNNSILMSKFQSRVSTDYENTTTFVKNVDSSVVTIGVRDGYFQKANYKQPRNNLKSSSKTLFIYGLAFIILANIISYHTRLDLAFGSYTIIGVCCIIASIFLNKKANKHILLTQYGEDEYAKWRGLYNFLNSNTLINERTFVELPLWEKYLIYATAFGISEKVIKAIGIRCPEASESEILSNNYYRSGRFRRTGRRLRSATRSGSYSGGGGGGFGYGGGGRGGGGGGGGH